MGRLAKDQRGWGGGGESGGSHGKDDADIGVHHLTLTHTALIRFFASCGADSFAFSPIFFTYCPIFEARVKL